MDKKIDVYSHFWDEKFGINFDVLEKAVEKEEISWRAKLIKLNKNEKKAKERYLSWFKDKEGAIRLILLNKKFNLLNNILKNKNYKEKLPKYSCLLEITFKLKKPYISKDDDNFYIIDNPIVKDKVFKLPMIRASTWKGVLRYAAIKVFEEKFNRNNWKELRLRIYKLFGNEKGIDDKESKYLDKFVAKKIYNDKDKAKDIKEEFKNYIKQQIGSLYFKGRLFFYTTFFDRISLDVITPLSRETKTPVRGPIYFEIVPEETTGILRIFYYPFDLVAKGEFDKIEKEMKEDMKFLSKVIYKALYEIGFSAKKTSGYGTAEIVEVSVTCGDKLKEYESWIRKLFESKGENNDR